MIRRGFTRFSGRRRGGALHFAMMPGPSPMRAARERLTLADLIDLEQQLRQGAAESPAAQARRDAREAPLAARLLADAPDDRTLLARWVRQRRPSGGPSAGERFERGRRLASTLLVALGLLIGAGLVWGWLAVEHGQPINVIHFWAVLVGVQLLLLALFGLAVMRARLGGGSSGGLLHETIALIAGLPLWARLRGAPAWGRLRTLHRSYARVSFWLIAQATQAFAVAFNLGAIAALVISASVTDPSFGWRSTLLDERTVHGAARTLAQPWAWASPRAAPTREQVYATRYTSLDPRFVSPEPGDAPAHEAGRGVWAAWFGFLLGSLVCYGLAPRIVLVALCRARLSAALAHVPAQGEARRLIARLRRPRVETRALEPECGGSPEERTTPDAAALPRGAPCRAIAWAGVAIDDPSLRRLLAERFELDAVAVVRAGTRDVASDRAAIEEACAGEADDPIVLVIEAWDPPVGEHLDFIKALRAAAGEERPILVALYDRGATGEPVPPNESAMHHWRGRLATMGDAALRVDSLAEPATDRSAATGAGHNAKGEA